jgi:RNA polymerase sigma factor (sigma-70 family)
MEKIETLLLENVHEFVGFARRRLDDPELAADAVQESLLKALKAADQLRDEESAKAWFYSILRRTIIDLYRRRDARTRVLEDFERELDSAPDVDEERLVCGCMKRLLPTMTPQYAELVRELDLNGADPQAIAAKLRITRNNLNVRLHRARQQLKQRLEENCRACAKHGCLDCHCGTDAENAG